MVKSDGTEKVVEAAKAAGATGATIIPARGTDIHEAKTFFGMTLEAHTEVLFFLLEKRLVKKVLNAVYKVGRFEQPRTGIAFVINVEHTVGLESQMEYFRQEPARN